MASRLTGQNELADCLLGPDRADGHLPSTQQLLGRTLADQP
jgi:hypothetical protein